MIKDLKDLKKILKLCRSEGIAVIKIGDIEVHLGPEPLKKAQTSPNASVSPYSYPPNAITEDTRIELPDELTEEQLLMWSSQGHNEAL